MIILTELSDVLSAAKANMLHCDERMCECKSTEPIKEFLNKTEKPHLKLYANFNAWVNKLAEKNPNWDFWVNFVFRDCLSYLCLYLAMRSDLWNLRVGGIKKLAPMFAAFDRPHYQKLIPNHLHDLAKMTK